MKRATLWAALLTLSQFGPPPFDLAPLGSPRVWRPPPFSARRKENGEMALKRGWWGDGMGGFDEISGSEFKTHGEQLLVLCRKMRFRTQSGAAPLSRARPAPL